MTKFVVLNDTRGDHHFGSQRVMHTIARLIHAREGKILAYSRVRNDWEDDQRFLSNMSEADVILINGEGTMHHGSIHAEKLLKVVDHPNRADKPVCVVNALYQDNPSSWDAYLKKIAVFGVRDSASFAAIQPHVGPMYYHTLDYSLYEPASTNPKDSDRSFDIFGDSVSRTTKEILLELSQKQENSIFLPILQTFKPSKPDLSGLSWVMREIYIRAHRETLKLRSRNVRFCRSEMAYLDWLTQGRRHLTGRFHALCLSLLTETPTVAVSSNSWKNEQLIADTGINPSRITSLENLDPQDPMSAVEAFSIDELNNLRAALQSSRVQIDATFDKIFSLAI